MIELDLSLVLKVLTQGVEAYVCCKPDNIAHLIVLAPRQILISAEATITSKHDASLGLNLAESFDQ